MNMSVPPSWIQVTAKTETVLAEQAQKSDPVMILCFVFVFILFWFVYSLGEQF